MMQIKNRFKIKERKLLKKKRKINIFRNYGDKKIRNQRIKKKRRKRSNFKGLDKSQNYTRNRWKRNKNKKNNKLSKKCKKLKK